MSSPAPVEFRDNSRLHTIFGVIPFAAGIAALIGWHTGDLRLAAAINHLPPMHYVTAAAFLLCAAGIFFSGIRIKTGLFSVASFIIAIGVFDLIENLFGLPFDAPAALGLQQISRAQFHSTAIGAVSFVFVGLAWVIAGRKWKYRQIVSGAMGAFVFACGAGTLLGFVAGYPESLKWGNISEPSIASGIAFAVTGAIIIFQSRNRSGGQLLDWSHYIPVGIMVACLVASFCARQALHVQEIDATERTVALQLRNLRYTFELEMGRWITANERMAKRWNVDQGPLDRSAWERDALSYCDNFKTYQSLAFIGENYEVRWSVPLHPDKSNLDLRPSEGEKVLIARDRASGEKRTIISRSINLPTGGSGIFSYSPIYNNNEFKGLILGVFRTDKFFEYSIPISIRDDYSVAIRDGGRLIYSTDNAFDGKNPDLDQTTRVELGGTTFLATIRPSQKRIYELSSRNEDLALLVGTLISILFSWSTFLALKARRHNNVTETANKLLKSEIEERKKVERKLRDTSTSREAILNGANYIIISTDRAGLITSFNKTAEYLLGYTADEVIGKLTLDQFHEPSEISKYGEELFRRFGYKELRGFEPLVIRAKDHIADEREWTYICKDNSAFPVTLSVTSIVDERGKVTGFLGIARDNSQLKIASRLLVESEERFKAFVNNTPALTYIKDRFGRYRFVNTNFEKLFEVTQDSILGKSDFAISGKTATNEVLEIEKRVLETGTPEESVEPVILSDGRTAPFLFVRFVVPMSGGEDCLGVIAIDHSSQKAIEEELREASYAAVESSRMKSEFLANMSHEIRTPMNGVLGMLEVLLDTQLNSSQREYAKVIQESAKSLLMILDDVLDFSKLEAGKLMFETIEFDLRSVVENTLLLFTEQCEAKKIEITSLIEPDIPPGLLGDPGRVRQVLTNLIGNAVKFTDTGEITVRVSQSGPPDDEVSLKFEIVDTGIGIAKDAQLSLFKPFIQADGSMVRKYGGTGLGLSISKQLVEIMNGEISVESIEGKGSTFRFTAIFGVQNSVKQVTPSVDLSGRRVLIADDHQTNRESIAGQLRGLGLVTTAVPDGESCIQELMWHAEAMEPFDIVMLDHEMPGLSGLETAEIIKNVPAISDTKIVLMPSHGRRGHAKAAMQNGISAYLTKPVRQVELFDCVATVLSGKAVPNELSVPARKEGLVTRHSLLENRKHNGSPILIVANSVKNQNLISMQLELLGYRSEVVSNSIEAFAALKNRTYSLIFLHIDGQSDNLFAITGGLRDSLDRVVPIIGITPDPSEEERALATEAGMNDYLSMPFSEEDLRRKVTEFVECGDVDDQLESPAQNDVGLIHDKEMEMYIRQLSDEIGPEMVAITVSLFTEDTARHMNQISVAVKNGNIDAVTGLAGSLGLVCDNLHASELKGYCLPLGTAAKNGDLEELKLILEQFGTAFEAAIAQLGEFEFEPMVS